jgi:hypothetical protein
MNTFEYFRRTLAPRGSVLTLVGHSLPRSGRHQDRADARANCKHVSEFGRAEPTQLAGQLTYITWNIEADGGTDLF